MRAIFKPLERTVYLGIGTYQQDCGPGCVSGTPPNVYYACSGSSCNPTLQGLAQQITNPVWVFPADNNGTLIQVAVDCLREEPAL